MLPLSFDVGRDGSWLRWLWKHRAMASLLALKGNICSGSCGQNPGWKILSKRNEKPAEGREGKSWPPPLVVSWCLRLAVVQCDHNHSEQLVSILPGGLWCPHWCHQTPLWPVWGCLASKLLVLWLTLPEKLPHAERKVRLNIEPPNPWLSWTLLVEGQWCSHHQKRGGIDEAAGDEFVEIVSRTSTPKKQNNWKCSYEMLFSLSSFQTKHGSNLLDWRRACFFI